MFLDKLEILDGDSLVREIKFHKGINLIIDETASDDKTDSGNSVGKTTVLRLIDFCLDGKGKNIYIDPEFKTTNEKVEKFLKENNVLIRLSLVEDIDDKASNRVVIERNFLERKRKIQRINGVQFKNADFTEKLKELIFKTDVTNPTFKQLKSKNIRDEKNKLVNTLRVLSQNVVTDAVYETLHLFWFGIIVDLDKDTLIRERNIETKIQGRLMKDSSPSMITQTLLVIDKEIEILTKRKDTFNLNEKYEEELEQLNNEKRLINKHSTELSRLEIRKDLIIESKDELEKDMSNVNTEQLKLLYERAKFFIPQLHKTYEETVAFHNKMIQEKSQFITKELPEVESEISQIRSKIQKHLVNEKKLTESLHKSGAIEELQEIIEGLNSLYERKGKFEERGELWKNSVAKMKRINDQLDQVNETIGSKDDLIQKRISEFNEYFADISKRLDGISSLLSADNPTGVYKFSITNIEGNPGTGGKKSQMASFDLAYIKFADEHDIPCLHFVLQDQIENVHSNQISSLFNELVNEVNCQYVLSVLRDKLPNDVEINELEVVSLSRQDRLFRI